MKERRIVRSSEPKTAIYLYLVHQAQKLGLRALALVSAEGLLVTGTKSDERIDLEELAAIGPRKRFDLFGEPFYLAGIGGTLPGIGEVKATLARILE
jgi:hypothetical protein